MFESRTFTVFVVCSLISVNAQTGYPATANLSTVWRYNRSDLSVGINQGSFWMPILYKDGYACGFYSIGNVDNSYFGIFIVVHGTDQLVWSANRNSPFKNNSTLELTSDGDLILKESNGNVSWSTSTSGKSVVGMSLTGQGNLILFDDKNNVVWESFDYPTDTMVPGQKLKLGRKLRPNVSTTNFTETGSLSLSVTVDGLFAFVEETDLGPPQMYYKIRASDTRYVQYLNGSISLFYGSGSNQSITPFPFFPVAASFQFIRFGADGHLRVYEWLTYEWRETADLLTSTLGVCGYPTVCGAYGICLDGQCSCPPSSNGSTYFKQLSDQQPNLGCSETTSLSCRTAQNHSFLELKNVSHSTSRQLWTTDLNSCINVCSMNCSCRAAFFQYGRNTSVGECNLQQQVLSMANGALNIPDVIFPCNYVAYIKVVDVPSTSSGTPRPGKKGMPWYLLPRIVGMVALGIVIGIVVFFVIRKYRRNSVEEELEDGTFDQVPGMPTRFKYDELKAATDDFRKKIGEGGYGSVFEGVLSDGTRIAVKRLEGLGQIKKSFLAEVLTIGNIHHVNLVRLIGFCAEKSHRLLVYEFMGNGSLERWIFSTNHRKTILAWNQRKTIILDIAKGLSYLHEECRQKIIHLDIKPQNILLDDNFNAKVSDFGLSKLIDRNQSHVTTTMKGTIGYLAPEWLGAKISEKVDIYSFGVVILEIVCGRKVIDTSLDEEDMYLLNLLKRKVKEDKLVNMVDKRSEDMQLHEAEAVSMMRIAAWCLQGDVSKRPSISMVIKVFDGAMDLPDNLEYNFSNPCCTKATTKAGHKDGLLGPTTL